MLSEKQKAFAAARARGLNGLEAAREAGYSGNDATLKVTASRLIRHPGVRAELEQRAAETGAAIEGAVADDPEIAGPIEQQRILTSIARSRGVDPETKIKAINALSKIQLAVLPRQGGGSSSATATAQVVVVVDNGRGPRPS